MRLLWELDQAGGTLAEEDALTSQLMREHRQWQHIWERADEVSDEELEQLGSNPFLHITIHQVVLNQIDGDLPAATEALNALLEAELDQHEAQHRIGEVLASYVFDAAQGRAFDQKRYVRDLQAMVKRESRSSRRK